MWMLEEIHNKVSLQLVLSTIHPAKLKYLLELYISLSHHSHKNDFAVFLKHAKTVFNTFVLIYGGLNEELGTQYKKSPLKHGKNKAVRCSNTTNPTQAEPICLWEPQNYRVIRHKLKTVATVPENTIIRS